MSNNITAAKARDYLTYLHFGRRVTVLEAVRSLQSVQYDPLNVVGRNPDLVLQCRVRRYKPDMLAKELYERHTLIEGPDKMLCIYLVEDYPYFARLRDGWIPSFREQPELKAASEAVLNEVRKRGALCSDDIDLKDKIRWPWGEAKLSRAGLEDLWLRGKLTVHHREGARRYYDLAERHIPESILNAPDPNQTDAEYYAWQLLRRMRSVGMLRNTASDAFLGVEGFKAAERAKAFKTLLEKETIFEINIDGKSAYVPREYAYLALDPPAPARKARLLAPLDNFIWDRKLISGLFGFDYRWEVYTPKEQRKHGYYVLPVMYKSAFVARCEPANFRGGTLEILNWWWEDGVKRTPAMLKALRDCLDDFCAYLGADGYKGVEF